MKEPPFILQLLWAVFLDTVAKVAEGFKRKWL